jgi:uncharacterized protein YxeA
LIYVKRKNPGIIVIVLMLVAVTITGTLLIWHNHQCITLFSYPISVDNKTFTVTLEANWEKENPPKVSLINASAGLAVELYFRGGDKKSLTYDITIPTGLVAGNVSVIWKYYLKPRSLCVE